MANASAASASYEENKRRKKVKQPEFTGCRGTPTDLEDAEDPLRLIFAETAADRGCFLALPPWPSGVDLLKLRAFFTCTSRSASRAVSSERAKWSVLGPRLVLEMDDLRPSALMDATEMRGRSAATRALEGVAGPGAGGVRAWKVTTEPSRGETRGTTEPARAFICHRERERKRWLSSGAEMTWYTRSRSKRRTRGHVLIITRIPATYPSCAAPDSARPPPLVRARGPGPGWPASADSA